ncbi:hypothetical protein ACFOY2_05805 [Nonomuraea purpurea]|uniref:Uncharacterized protein n=1 Tax=Nonomuraea purpurea TaxID=1849276 RepID=A0ABV8FYA5_9ACTN
MKRLMALLVAVVALALGGGPAAAAGGLAVTFLDPGPSRFEAGTPYTLGFWVLQQGTHLFPGDLGTVALRFTRQDGESLRFEGTALPEAGHYATSVVVPGGVWKVEGIQGVFRPYDVGTLTVPGGLTINPVPPGTLVGGQKDYWGAVRPPGFPVGKGAPVAASPAPSPSSASSAPVAPVAGSGGVPAYMLLVAGAGGAVVAVLAPYLWRRVRPARFRDEPERPLDASSETIGIPR